MNTTQGKRNTLFALFLVLIVFNACKSKEVNPISFYHWKNDTSISLIEKQYLDKLKVKEVYVRFFDVKIDEDNIAYPVSVVRKMDFMLKNVNVVPVVYITNKTFLETKNVMAVVEKVHALIDQMYEHHFDVVPRKIQIDCDWNGSSKDNYFRFLEELSFYYNLSVTIRLHQVKYPKQTGIPPADEGTLMVYNMGDLKDSLVNSILSTDILKQYINEESSYLLKLDMALPIYSWGVLTFPSQEIKLLNNLTYAKLDSSKFKKINKLSYEVIEPHFLQGFYLPIKSVIKIEENDFDEVLIAKKYLDDCDNIQWNNTILYHLDEEVLLQHSVEDLNLLAN